MVVVQGAFNEALRPGFLDAFADEYPGLPAVYPSLVPVISSQRAFEEWLITTGLGTTPEKPEGEPTPMDRPLQVGTVKVRHTSYGLGYGVSHEAMINDLYGVIVDPSARFLAQSQRDVEERKAHAIFNLAATTQQAFDGVSLINSAHPLAGGGTQANRPATDEALSVGALQASRERFRKLVNERGIRIRYRAEKLLVPPELEQRAEEILLSPMKPFTANNEINVANRMGLTHEVSEYLTSATAWFNLAARQRLRFFFVWRERPTQSDDFDKKKRIAEFFNHSIFSLVSVDYRGIDGSTG
ncbi:MAG: hypothetical protein GTO63_30265 [Anaerolineae bacterium]|nr:hypothetical protein [Anaerolineae bacterium]NIN98990.1 hypothetical protein [Anaerolineae bacterium]